MANMYINDMSEVWTSIGTSYSAIKMNVTNAASMTTPVISKLLHLQVGGSDKFTVDKNGGVLAADTVTAAGFISATAPLPLTNDGAALGSAAAAWSDLYLATGGVINWNNADVTITHAPETLIFAGATDGYWFDSALRPVTADLAPLGTSARPWSDLYLASGGVIDWAAADITLTHSGNTLTFAGGTFAVSGNLTATGTLTATGAITGGSFTTASTITATGVITGGTLTTAGNLNCSAAIANSAYFIGGGTAAVLGTPSGAAGIVYLRPNGYASGTNQGYMRNDGYFIAPIIYGSSSLVTPGTLTVSGGASIGSTLTSGNGVFQSNTHAFVCANGGNIYFRPNGVGSAVDQVYINTNGTMVVDPNAGGGLLVNQPTNASYAIRGYGPINAGGVLGYSANTAQYGICGFYENAAPATSWAFYGAGNARVTGTWQTSDARIKSEIADCDCHDAYAKVRAIGVKSYRKYGARRGPDFDEMGFLAQEVEAVLPEAVMECGIPEFDKEERAAVGGDRVKLTNYNTLLSVLWAAVQHQAEMIENLESKLITLEGKGNY